MENLAFLYKRHSVRKFSDEIVPEEIIRQLITAATYAPSGKNKQNWHFVVILDKAKIAEIARLVEQKNAKLADRVNDEQKAQEIKSGVRYATVFKGAPALVLVFAGPYGTIADLLSGNSDLSPVELEELARPNPGIQNIAAAMENLQLAAASLGYGTCWMTGPTYAATEITEYIGREVIPEGYYLAAMTPLGVPAAPPLSRPPRKPIEEVLTILR